MSDQRIPPQGGSGAAPSKSNGHLPPELLSRMLGPVVNAMTQPFTRLRALMDPRRDVEAECGYPSLGDAVPLETYWRLYERDAVAARVVEVYPAESWQVTPSVYEDEDAETPTDFEAAVDALGGQLYEEPDCVYAEEEGSPVWRALRSLDVLSGVGHYGIGVYGFSDGKDLREPVVPTPGLKLTFFTPLPEHMATITAVETNKKSRRYGLPTQYAVTLDDRSEQYGATPSAGVASSTATVHWSRVLHVCDGSHQASTSRVYAAPRMRCVLNQLLGLHKLYASAPEMFWLAALPLYKFTTHADLGGDVEVDSAEIKDAVEQVRNGLQRWLLGRGGDWSTIAPSVVDPAGQIAVQLEAVCVKLGCPVRVFKGSERGELASSQDDQAWNDRLKARQQTHVSPAIIAPFFSRLISLGVLPRPKRLKIWWPDLTSVSDGQKADVAVKKTTALAQYVGGNVESLVAPTDYLTRFLDFTEEEAAAILDNAGGAVPSGDGVDLGQTPDPAAQPDYAPEPSANAWSEAAREAAIAARRAKSKDGGKPEPKQAGKAAAAKPASGRGKPADVKVKAAADKVAAINKKVTAAKAKLASLSADLKAAKADLAKAKAGVKEGAKKPAGGKGPTKADAQAKTSAAGVKSLTDAAVAVAAKSKNLQETGKVDVPKLVQGVRDAVGKSSPHKVARELGMGRKFPSAAAAMKAIEQKVVSAVGTVERVHA